MQNDRFWNKGDHPPADNAGTREAVVPISPIHFFDLACIYARQLDIKSKSEHIRFAGGSDIRAVFADEGNRKDRACTNLRLRARSCSTS